MRKLMFTLVAGTFLMFSANAQSISGGIDLAVPMGDFGDVYDLGFGFSGKAEFPVMPKLSLTGTAGILFFSGEQTYTTIDPNTFATVTATSDASSTMIPILVGAKYSLVKGVYGFADLGLTFISSEVESGNFTAEASDTEFTFNFGAGYEYPITPMIDLDVSAKFAIISDSNFLGLRAGLKFGL